MTHENESAEANAAGMDLVHEMEFIRRGISTIKKRSLKALMLMSLGEEMVRGGREIYVGFERFNGVVCNTLLRCCAITLVTCEGSTEYYRVTSMGRKILDKMSLKP